MQGVCFFPFFLLYQILSSLHVTIVLMVLQFYCRETVTLLALGHAPERLFLHLLKKLVIHYESPECVDFFSFFL